MKFCILLSLFFTLNFFYSQSPFNNDLKWALNNYQSQPLHLIVQANQIDKFLYQCQQFPQAIKNLYFVKNLVRCVIYDTSFLFRAVREKWIVRAEMYKPKKFKPLNDTMVVRNRILPVKQGLPPLTQSYDATGVLFGLIDSGIDFSHPDFKDSNGNTRILYIWDQTVTSPTNSPNPFGYGQEWDSTSINNGTCTHNDLTYWGHGTHVAGIAAGNGSATGTHQGCAAKATIIAVALDFNSNTPVIADAVQYLVNKAPALNMPISINASVGDYYGSHDATDLQSQMIVSLISNVPGRLMSAAAGNAGNIKFHAHTICSNSNDTLFTWLENNSANTFDYWLYADTNDIKNVQISVGCNRPDFSYIGNIGFKSYNYALSFIQHDTLKNNNNQRIGIIHSSASINSFGVYELYIQISVDSTGYLWSIESKGNGQHHAWNFDFKSTNLPTFTQYPKMQYYVMPDTVSSIVSGFQCSSEIITVGNYVNLKQYYDYNNVLQTTSETAGQLAYHSSAGPTRTGLLKPDITASGNSIFSCVAMGMQSNLIANYPNYLAPGGYHVLGGGTSAASPVVAGLGLLYLQAFPNATNQQFKNAVTSCAYSDIFTGTTLPNNKWGYGKLDGLATFTCSPLNANNNDVLQSKNIVVYPNPSNEKNIFIKSNYTVNEIQCYDVSGRKVNFQWQKSYDKSNSIELLFQQKGFYLLRINVDNEIVFKSVIVN
ncbi:MAG: hypothetical protein KatS3mg027_2223 [Bacteroidia bacterium]|nr:MAG: hypothetical protein KatS3mg027_2223 [Bacteroidia bacterium]